MSTVIQYDNDFRQKVLKDNKKGHSIEELAEQYSVPAIVIKNWIDRDKAESYLNACFTEEKPSHESRGGKIKSFIKKAADSLKEYFGYTCLLIGIILVIILCVLFKSDTGFVPSTEPIINNIAPQVDTISIRSLRIESLLERHLETVNDISNTATDVLVNQEQQFGQLKTLIRKTSDIEDLCKENLDTCDASK